MLQPEDQKEHDVNETISQPNPYIDATLMKDLTEFNPESNGQFMSEHEVFVFPKTIETPPESNEYYFDEDDKQIGEYLLDTYREQIQEFTAFGDDIIFRFVCGYRNTHDVEERLQQTDELFTNYLKWRKSCDYEQILKIEHINNVSVNQYIKGCYVYGQNIYGHPIFYDEGLKYRNDADMSIFKECGEEGTDQVLGYLLQLLQQMKDATNKYYGLQTKLSYKDDETKEEDMNDDTELTHIGIIRHCVVFDLAQFDVVRSLKDVKVHEYFFRRFSALFPEMMHKAYVINTPWVFKTVWKLVKSFLHPNTVKKTVILGTDYKEELFKEIHPDFVPTKYGGTGKWEIVYGNIPKDYPIQYL